MAFNATNVFKEGGYYEASGTTKQLCGFNLKHIKTLKVTRVGTYWLEVTIEEMRDPNITRIYDSHSSHTFSKGYTFTMYFSNIKQFYSLRECCNTNDNYSITF